MDSSSRRATAFGLIAIVLWSTSVGLMRSISEHFGPTGGAALLYTISSLCLCLASGLPKWRTLPGRYRWVGGTLFVSYEISLALSIGLAHTRGQSLELGMINYLWPCLTVVMALFINGQRSSWLLWPGLALSLAGIVQVMKGGGSWSAITLWRNILDNPPAYGLAFSAAVIWALYCNLTRRWSAGANGVPLFFCATAVVLWLKYSQTSEAPMHFTLSACAQLLFMGISSAVAYSAWNQGIQKGSITLLATASYFTPVLSALLASLWLGLQPSWSFWQGVLMVVGGSLLSWLATRRYS